MKNKAKFMILFFVMISVGVLTQIWQGSRADSHNNFFSYDATNSTNDYVQVLTGEPLAVPFEFKIGDQVSEVALDLADDSDGTGGVNLAHMTVPVREGIAASEARFSFDSKEIMKAGTYYLNINARDTATGDIIRTGRIPFIVDMHDIILKCSC